MITRLVDAFIRWAMAREPHPIRVVRHEDRQQIMERYQPLWPDEWLRSDGEIFDPLPWWCPVNVLLHHWVASQREEMHDHPRWSITVVLRGKLIEHTPWSVRPLKPGSIVVRSRKAIHALEIVEGEDPWTLFIVGRRKHSQSGFLVMPFGSKRPTITWDEAK